MRASAKVVATNAGAQLAQVHVHPRGLSALDYLFRALAILSVLEFGALLYDFLAHPSAEPFSKGATLLFRVLCGLVIGPLSVLISGLILWRVPGNVVGRFLLLYAMGFTGWQFSYGLGSPEFSSLCFELFYLYWGIIGFPALAYLLLTFPTGQAYPPRMLGGVVVFVVIKTVGTILEVMSVQPGSAIVGAPFSFNPFFVPSLAPYQSLISGTIGAQGLLMLVGLVASLSSLVFRYRASRDRERQQIKWLAWSASVIVPFTLIWVLLHLGVDTATALPEQSFFDFLSYILWITLPVFSIGIAILRYRLFDIDLILNRTLVYGALTAFVIGIYVLVVGSFSVLSQASGNLIISLLATGLVAILFQPLRERLQRAVNRLMYGERDEPYTVLSRLGQQLEATLTPEAVLPTIVQTLANALKLPYVGIELGGPGESGSSIMPKISAACPSASNYSRPSDLIRLPLVYQTETIGQLVLAPRTAGESFTPADQRLLNDLARQVGVAAHAVRLTADLQRSREHLVLAREEERRRLRRDLHDGLGPALANLAMQGETARDLLPSDPLRSETLLTNLVVQSQAAIADIRRLVYDLRPPALDELGLVSALREQTAQYESPGLRFTFIAPDSLPPLPAATEVAAYRIVQEALTNVVRHAQARNCLIHLDIDHLDNEVRDMPLQLRLEIRDDGCGLPVERHLGIGLTSMRERAEELGGVCTIEPSQSRGTLVVATLPIVQSSSS